MSRRHDATILLADVQLRACAWLIDKEVSVFSLRVSPYHAWLYLFYIKPKLFDPLCFLFFPYPNSYFTQLQLYSSMAIQNGSSAPSQKQEKPWVETPLKESSSLSKAAKWYDLSCHAKFKLSNISSKS